ncbi:galactokinase [Chryseolinea lacunae]|uniref:Galactokinase n=1 Tax=Chryseolinea lacunae TaxID=2801331 RepID=A0ABS1L1P8_9BACT|nr:galactokinase [Chryseolinea lacunae]MBL0745457.1 galactokinase [Chryseolinea lacunae]
MNQTDVLNAKESLSEFQPADLRNKFLELYHQEPLVVRSPGRINLIGEHTDYNEGFVMPAAIDREILVGISSAQGPKATLYSVKHDETVTFDVNNPEKVENPAWANYLLGVVRQFVDKGYDLKPFHAIIGGNVPTGAGLSSSAALECGFAFAVDQLHGFQVPKLDLIHMAQWAEHHYVGVKCGIMDQFSSMMGAAGQAFVLDCRSLSYRYFPVDLKDYTIVLCDTMVKHSLANSAYNTRRSECEKGVAILKEHYPAVRSLRDVTADMLQAHRDEFPGKVYDRCIYIVAENERVLQASEDLAKGNLNAFGQRLYASHDGLSRLYEVSCLELDFLVDEAKKFGGVLGARMMGGGFGGCTINIVKKDRVNEFIDTLKAAYQHTIHREMVGYVVALKDGTSIVPLTAKEPSLL